MSKFYVAGNVSDQSDDDEVQKNVEADKNRKKKFDVDDDDNYHEQKNKMQTEKQKKNAVFKKLSSTIIAAVNIGDFDRAWDALQQFIKEIQKSAKYIQKQGLPALFLKTLKIVNKQVSSVDAQAKKSMKNPKSFNIMRQKLKNKIIPQYKDKLDNFKEQPSAQQQSQQSEQKELISSSDQSQEEVYKKYLESDDPHIRRKYWLKRQKKAEEEQEGRKDTKQDGAEKRKPSQPTKPKHHITIVQKKKQQLIIASAKQAQAEMTKILKQFAKLNSTQKRQQYLGKLDSISKQSTNYPDFQKLSFLLVDIPIRFQVTRQLVRYLGETNFSRTSWNKIFNNVVSIFTLLRQSQDDDLLQKIAAFQEQNQQAKLGTTQKDVYSQIKSFINSLERELSRAFDFLESNEDQYCERLQDLIKFTEFMYKLSNQMAFKQGLQKDAAQISFKVLENMYFMNSQLLQKIGQFSSDLTFTQLSDQKTLQLYIKPILKLNKQDYTTKTLLYVIYNYAINRRDKGKDLLILTDISQTIATRDYFTQVCFNRALVQLGVSTFYQGNVYETQQILSGIVTKKEKKEENLKLFLGQAKPNDRDTVRHKQLPKYLHINTDLVEAIELIASMILQVPYTLNQGSKITSRTYKKLVQHYERTHYIPDPSNYKDLIYTASNDLKLGNLKKCYEKLSQIYIWKQLGNSQVALQNLKQNLKQTALKCYIATNKKCFTSISLEDIAQKFEIDVKTARKIICRQISQKKIIGVITSDGYLKLTQKRKQKESGLANINSNLFLNIQQLNKANEQIFKQRIEVDVPEAQDQVQKQKNKKKLHDVITEKLKNILSRRAA